MRTLAVLGAVLAGVACAEYVVAPQERVVRALQLSLQQLTIDEGQTASIATVVLDQFGQPFTQLPAGVALTWSSSADNVAVVDATGAVTGKLAGDAQITADVSGDFGHIAASATATIRPLVTGLAAVAGDAQTGPAGLALPQRLRARVTNRLGAGVPGIVVDFAITTGGGSLDSSSVATDSLGFAEVSLTLGTVVGANTVEASTVRLPGVVARFTAQAVAGPLSAVAKASGDNQTAGAGVALGAPLTVQALDRFGNGVPGISVTWSVATGGGSVNPASTTTDLQGQAATSWTLGSTPGAQTVTATVGGTLSATFNATASVPVATVSVTPANPTVASGSTQQFTATPRDASGNALSGRTIVWMSDDATIASIDGNGLATAHLRGSTKITATVEGVSGTTFLTVVPGPASLTTSVIAVSQPTVVVGDAVSVTLTTKDAAGNQLTSGGLVVAFSVSGGTSSGTFGPVADHADGTYAATFTATTAGTPTTVGATIGGQAVTTAGPTIQVATDTVVATVSITPASVTVASGATQQLTATPKNAAGDALTGKTVAWVSGTPSVASISATGVVTGALVGTATITATVQGVTGNATVTVTPGPVSTMTSVVSVAPTSVAVGQAATLTLSTKDAAGNPLTSGGHTVVFSATGGTGAGTIGQVTDHGDGTYTATFTATTSGTALTIGATIDGQPVTSTLPTLQVTTPSNIVHWIGGGSNLWSDAANWSPARVPTPQDTAVVDAPGNYTVINAGSDVGGLVIGATSGSNAAVQINGPVTMPGALLVRAGDTLYVNEALVVGSFRNDGVIVVDGSSETGVLAIDSVGVRTALNYGTIAGVGGGVVDVSNASSLVNHGSLSPGTPKTGDVDQMTVAGNVTMAVGSVVSIDLGGPGYRQADVVGITGTATLGDTLRVQLTNGYAPTVGDAFMPVVWTGYSGTFGTVQLPALANAEWQVSYTSVGLTLTVAAIPSPSVSVYQGDGQSATVGTSVAVPPAVRLVDASSNPIAGTSVTFAVASGGGSIAGPATVTTDASGIAQVGGWQLGPTPGANTLTATVSGTGIAGNPVTFTATGLAAVKTWTGAVSTDWSNAGNWSPVGIPDANYDVSIGAAANEPTLTTTAAARTVNVSGSGAILTVGGQTLSVTTLNITQGGLLIMTNPSDVVSVASSVTFDGGNENGGLTAGELRLGGNFYQNVNSSPASFATSGSFRVAMTGAAVQGVTLVDLTGASSFQDLDISNSAGINIQYDYNGLVVKGTFTSMPTGATTPLLWGLGRSLTAQSFQINRLVVDYAPLILNEGNAPRSEQFDNVTFQDFRLLNGTAPLTQFTVTAQGDNPTARSLTFNALTFTPLTTGDTGHYLNVTAGYLGALNLTINGSNVTNGPAFTVTSANATVNWQ